MDRDENGVRGIFLREFLDGALIFSGEIVVMPTIDMLQIHPSPRYYYFVGVNK